MSKSEIKIPIPKFKLGDIVVVKFIGDDNRKEYRQCRIIFAKLSMPEVSEPSWFYIVDEFKEHYFYEHNIVYKI